VRPEASVKEAGEAVTHATIIRRGMFALACLLAFFLGAGWGVWMSRREVVLAAQRENRVLTMLSQHDALVRQATCAVALVGPPSHTWWAERRKWAGHLPLRPECFGEPACAGVEGCS
jgi:hypothetical protein